MRTLKRAQLLYVITGTDSHRQPSHRLAIITSPEVQEVTLHKKSIEPTVQHINTPFVHHKEKIEMFQSCFMMELPYHTGHRTLT